MTAPLPRPLQESLPTRTEARLEGSLLVWLFGLRWVIVLILAAALPSSSLWLGLPVSYAVAVPALVILAVANLVFHRQRGPSRTVDRPALLTAHVVLDVVAIAVVLGASGGAANPFSAILLVYVALAASMLPPAATFFIAGLAACTFGALFFVPGSASCHVPGVSFANHLYGMWVAFALGAGLVAFFLTRVRRALQRREAELAELTLRAHESMKFAALGTLAAGTAHELATPLGRTLALTGAPSQSRSPAVGPCSSACVPERAQQRGETRTWRRACRSRSPPGGPRTPRSRSRCGAPPARSCPSRTPT